MRKPSIKYTKENIENVVRDSISIAECLTKLNLAPKGGNYKTFKKHVQYHNIDTSHFKGQAWLAGQTRDSEPFYSQSLVDILVENSTHQYTRSLKSRLIKEGLLKDECSICGLIEWQGKKLSLHLDHINGKPFDNRIENLRLLCPNCHSITETYCGKNNRTNKPIL